MITLCTSLRGGVQDPIPLRFFEKLPEDSSLIATVNNEEDKARVSDLGGLPVQVSKWDGSGGEVGRHNYVASLLNSLITRVETSFLMLFDDDVLPTEQGFERILETFQNLPKGAAGLFGLYPFKGTDTYPVFFSQVLCPLPKESLPNDVAEVFTCAMGFSLWSTSAIKECLPLDIRMHSGSPMGTEWDLGFKMAENDRKVYVDGQVRCQHVNV